MVIGILQLKSSVTMEQVDSLRRAWRDVERGSSKGVLISHGIDFKFVPIARKVVLRDRVDHLRHDRSLRRLNYGSLLEIKRVNNEEGC